MSLICFCDLAGSENASEPPQQVTFFSYLVRAPPPPASFPFPPYPPAISWL